MVKVDLGREACWLFRIRLLLDRATAVDLLACGTLICFSQAVNLLGWVVVYQVEEVEGLAPGEGAHHHHVHAAREVLAAVAPWPKKLSVVTKFSTSGFFHDNLPPGSIIALATFRFFLSKKRYCGFSREIFVPEANLPPLLLTHLFTKFTLIDVTAVVNSPCRPQRKYSKRCL